MDLIIRLAEPTDSANLLALLRQLSQESDTFALRKILKRLMPSRKHKYNGHSANA
ncbi:Uncharacterised protein [Weissella viridescens]|uniref:Uncharacterized protein n=1 Tax=Weissella viridescens TaxID=1629 RepID=A0A380NVZ5_WEIVI|nr:Uncharacterised protein [Weissella viridescens]